MNGLPLRTGAVIVVGVHMVVVHVETCEERAAAGAAHGRGGVGVTEFCPASFQQFQSVRHVVEGALNKR